MCIAYATHIYIYLDYELNMISNRNVVQTDFETQKPFLFFIDILLSNLKQKNYFDHIVYDRHLKSLI